jgi:hypothetical protein
MFDTLLQKIFARYLADDLVAEAYFDAEAICRADH